MKSNGQIKVLLGTLLHAILLLFFSLYWLSLPNIYSDEAFFIKWTSLIKKKIFKIDPKPSPNEVLFVDISRNKTTIPRLNEFEEYSDYHQRVIVNRKHLADFLSLLSPYRDQIQHIFIDLLFENESPDDSLFQHTALALKDKCLIASRLDDEGNYKSPIFDLPTALTTYQTSQGMFLKYDLQLNDSLKTAPLALYERINEAKTTKWGGFHWINNKLALSAPVVDFKVRPLDFKVANALEDQHFSIHHMGTIIELSEFMDVQDVAAFFTNKLILIGDFQQDMHPTIFGEMAGPLILYNAYLTLVKESYRISFAWLLLLLMGFWFLSYVAFMGLPFKWPSFIKKPPQKWLEDTINESFILIIITILSYALFNIHINILILIVYLSIITFLWNQVPKFFKKRTPKSK